MCNEEKNEEKKDNNSEKEKKPLKTKVLSIDGGGIRGIIPLVILDEIEKRTGKQISDLFDYIAGTSTGGIIAMALTVPAVNLRNIPKFTAGRILEIYEEHGSEIFGKKRKFWHFSLSGIFPWITNTLKQFLTPKELLYSIFDKVSNLLKRPYSSDGLDDITKKIFGDEKFEDLLKTTIITAYETDTRTAQVFNSKDCNYQHICLTDLAKATSAAPLFFEAHEMNKSSYVDGGMFANNPLLCAYIEIIEDLKCDRLDLFEQGGIKTPPKECIGKAENSEPPKTDERWFCFNVLHENLTVVSLGTGGNYKPFLHKDISKWGLVRWGLNFFDIITDGVNDTVQYQMQKILGDQYYRLQLTIEEEYSNIDDTSEENIKSLVALARHYININDRLIDEVCKAIFEDYNSCKQGYYKRKSQKNNHESCD